jgi:ubiquinone/menaquinone biosynthesis C-methylase UbiE
MSHEHHRHEHDKGFMAKVRWLLKIRSFWQSDTNRAVVDLVDPQPGELVLDIGAGMGPATMLAAGRGASVVAVDPSGFMRSICGTRRLFQRARGRITVEPGTAERLPVAGGSIDALLTVNAVHHWVDLDLAFAELARVLAPGGRLVLMDEDFTHPEHPMHETHHGHEDEMTNVNVDAIAASLSGLGLEATGERTVAAGVPVKLIRATRPA